MKQWLVIGLAAGVLGAVLAQEGEGEQRPSGRQEVKITMPETMPVYTKANAPAAPKLESLEKRDKLSQDGITWTFDKPVPVGRFINGDYYIVGPVTITMIDPKPLHGAEVPDAELDKYDKRQPREKVLRNGSSLNPPATNKMALDSGVRSFCDLSLDTPLPIAMKPGDTLISSISLKMGEKAGIVGYGNGSLSRTVHDNCPVKVAVVLTCVAEPLPPDTFRPSYGDRSHTLYRSSNLKRELLPTLPRVEGARDPVKFAEVFQRVWLNFGFFGFDEPMENMPHYGQQVGQAVSCAGLLLCFDYKPEEKERLLVNFVQVGIDYWGLVKNGHPGWQAWGGHGSGRKWPIIFAGMLLGDEKMAAPTKNFPKAEFGEDNQTRFCKAWHGAEVVFAGHSGIQSASGKADRPQWGPYEHWNPADWDRPGQKNKQSDGYRRCCTSVCWVGEALAARILKAEANWNHEPFFDYVDRWMHQPEDDLHKGLAAGVHDKPKDWACQGNPGEPWIKAAWVKYRTAPGMPPTDGWTKPKDGPRINPADFPLPAPGEAKDKGKEQE